MAIFTSEELTEQISAWKAALLAVAASQSYTISNRTLTKADLPEIRNTLTFLEKQKDATAGRTGPHFAAGRVRR
jgi:hypothetical protein